MVIFAHNQDKACESLDCESENEPFHIRMSELPTIVKDLALILMIAGVATLLMKRLKQPLILGYIVAGFLCGPNLSIFPSERAAELLDNINANARTLRYELGTRVRHQLRIIPELRFYIDDSLDYIEHIDSLLKK